MMRPATFCIGLALGTSALPAEAEDMRCAEAIDAGSAGVSYVEAWWGETGFVKASLLAITETVETEATILFVSRKVGRPGRFAVVSCAALVDDTARRWAPVDLTALDDALVSAAAPRVAMPRWHGGSGEMVRSSIAVVTHVDVEPDLQSDARDLVSDLVAAYADAAWISGWVGRAHANHTTIVSI